MSDSGGSTRGIPRPYDSTRGNPGSNPALGKQWSRDYPMLSFATEKLSTGANEQKEDAASFFCARSFDRAIMGVKNCSPRLLPARVSREADSDILDCCGHIL